MAHVSFEFPIRELRGSIQHDGVVFRKKVFYSPDGIALDKGPTEMYRVHNPRNYKKNPPVGREKANIELNQKAWKQAADELRDPSSERYHYWVQRFNAQLLKGEEEAPVELTGKHKIYRNFRAFVRTAIRRQLLAEATANTATDTR
ncbi:MAG: hypothetical protein MJZ89_04085 [Paludibacteraceae bacterium]|nr:hypothetical protein [Paludibacteraceae bacterium]